ncbi:MAG: RHS repeat-associated core domain-containing protein [bacterium]
MKNLKILITLSLALFFLNAKAGLEPTLTSKRQGSDIMLDSVVTVTDDKYTCISADNCSPKFKTPVLKNAVLLGIDHDNTSCYQAYTFTVTLELEKFHINTPSTGEKDTIILTLSWNPDAGVISEDKAVYNTEGYVKITSKILSYTSTLVGNAVPDNIFIEGLIKKERYYALDYTTSPTISAITENQDDELTVDWTAVSGVEEYDLEYMYIDDFGDYDTASGTSYVSSSNISVDFRNNATRVTVKGTSHKLKNLYQHGYLLFRVRFVGLDTINYKQRMEGRWSSHSFGSTVATFGTDNADRYAITNNHEDTLNWQWTTSFAEEGKNKTVISYFDGSLRSRQMVTYTNTDQLTIVAESFYDHVGRKAIDALPVPTGDSIIKFYRNFNLSATTQETYSWKDFDTSATVASCNNSLAGMDTIAGASRYYSHNNPDKGLFQAYVPDAKQYPFVQVEFMPDNTGRVRRQSGVGYDHRMGSGHETQYFYGKPTQQELDMLFGVEVGDFNRYKKNMVVDPNGSISVSYLNPSGKVIATALAGENPLNLEVLPTDTARLRIVENLSQSIPEIDSTNMTIKVTHDLLLTSLAQVDFDYKIHDQSLNMDCSPDICYDCVYDLKFSVTNICGEKLYDTTFIAVQPFDTICANDSFEHTFSLVLDKGSYRVHKELAINLESLEYYEEVYLRNNTCENTLEEIYNDLVDNLDYSDCENTCTSCLDKLGSLADYKTSRYDNLDTNGLNQDSLTAQFESEYSFYVEKCNELCDTPSVCETEYIRLLQDVSPGGQYAGYYYDADEAFFASDHLSFLDTTISNDFPTYESMQRDYRNDSLVYYTANGDTAKILYAGAWVRPNNVPDSIFLANWDSEWAKTLVKLHPEYCYYEWCITNAASNSFDNRMRYAFSYDSASSDSLLDPLDQDGTTFPNSIEDPFFKTGGLGVSYKADFASTFNNYATEGASTYDMWEVAAITVSCKHKTTEAEINTCLTANSFGNGTTDIKDEQWNVFKSLYLAEKQKYVDTVRMDYAYTNNCANCYIGHNDLALYSTSCSTSFDSDSLVHKQKQYPSMRDLTTIPVDSGTNQEIIDKGRLYASNSLISECASQCEAYADNWMRALAGCNASIADSLALRDTLINICKLGCDQYNPLGAREIAPENRDQVISKNFREAVEFYFQTNKLCNADLIAFPYAYNHNYSDRDTVPMDSCFSQLLQDAIDSVGCTYSNEIATLESIFKDMADGDIFNPSITKSIQANVTSQTWEDFKDYLMSYTNGDSTGENSYKTALNGTNLVITIESVNGAIETCDITLELPDGFTTGFYDSINSTDYTFLSLTPNPNYCQSSPYKQFVMKVIVGSDTIDVEASSDCYKVCNDSLTVEEKVADYLNTAYCKNFTTDQIKDMLKVLNGCPYAVAFIPADLSCKPKCITCDKLYTAHNSFWDNYDGSIEPVTEPCIKSDELAAVETILKAYAGVSDDYFNSTTELILVNTLPGDAYDGFVDHLMSYTAGKSGSSNRYFTQLSGDDLVIYFKSYYQGTGVWDSCSVTIELPDGYTTGFYDSVRYAQYTLDSLVPTEDTYISGTPHRDFKAYFTVSGNSVSSNGDMECYHACRHRHTTKPDISCTKSDELLAIESLLTHYAGVSDNYFNTSTEIILLNTLPGTVYDAYRDYLMPYANGSTGANNVYVTHMSGDNLIISLKSYVSAGAYWDSCNITLQLPEGQTTGFYDSIRLGKYAITSIESNPDFLTTGPYKEFIIHMDIYGRPLKMYASSDCFPVCTPNYSLEFDTSFNFTDVYANYMNAYLGFNQDYYTYEELKANCDSFYITDFNDSFYNFIKFRNVQNGCDNLDEDRLDTLLNKLSLCDRGYAWIPDTISCDSFLRLQAYDEALRTYQAQQDTLRGKFRRAYLQKCMGNISALETFNMAYDIKQYHYTLYYYDQADNLVRTVPPAGVRPITDADTLALVRSDRAAKVAANYYNTPHHNLATNYKYNTLNAVFEQSTPDGGKTEFFYDRLGRLAVSQNAKQAGEGGEENHDYSYTLYDDLGRITEVGETQNTTTMDDATSRSPSSLLAWHSSAIWHREITRTYYDNKQDTLDSEFTDSAQQNIRNRVSYISYDEDGTGTYDYATYYSYDIHGNVKELVHDYSPLQPVAFGYFKLQYKYDLISGNVNKVSYQAGKQDQFYHQYVYDADNRINQVFTSRDDIHTDNDAHYYYYQHGPLARAEVGELKVQGMDYAYTIHGWLKGVNSNSLDSSRDIGKDGWWDAANNRRYIPKDEYGFTLGYYEGDYTSIAQHSTTEHFALSVSGGFNSASPSLYNGNIRHMVTAIGKFMEGGATPIGYAYKYDHLNRLASMNAYDSIDLANNTWYTGATALSQYRNTFTYDANGNILTQNRNGSEQSGLGLDSLTYHYYANTNKLEYVTDVVNAANYADDIDNQSAANYTYDAIGNLISDAAEEIDSIQWNVYGKISRIVRTPSSTKPNLSFGYGPGGNRVMKRVDYPNDTANRSYIEYYVRDAQGNIMATYTTSDPYFEPIDTSYEKIISKLIENKGLTAFAGFVQARFAADTAFYNRLGNYIPDSAMLNNFSTAQLISCGGDALFNHLFSCCTNCGANISQQIMEAVLDSTGANGYSMVEELITCKPSLIINAILQDNGSTLLTDMGSSARASLYAHFITAGYKHSNSTAGDTINFLLQDVPLSELTHYMAYDLAAALSMTQADYLESLADVITDMYTGTAAMHTALAAYMPPCAFMDCLGQCLTLANGNYSNALSSICSNIATNYLQDIYTTFEDSCSYSYDSLKQHLQTAPLRGFMHSRLQQCHSSEYSNKLVQSLIDRTGYSTMYDAGVRITEFGFDKYRYDSIVSHFNSPNVLTTLKNCDEDTLLYAVGQYNIKLLIDAIATDNPTGGTTYLNTAFATFTGTYPNPASLARDEYLAQVVPTNVLLADIKANFTNWITSLVNNISEEDMIAMLTQYYIECDFESCVWDKIDDGTLAYDSSLLINYTKDYYWSYLLEKLYDSDADTFTLHAAYTRPKIIADLFETWHLPLATFIDEVETHFDQATREAIDVDTIKKVQHLWVNEWNMYGSSRLGIFEAQKDTVRGVIRSYDHRVSNDTVSTAYFAIDTLQYNKFANDSIHYLHKGRKRYEGSNHLGNVLVVVSDKRLKVCTNDTIHFYRADVVNAYEYSPFGAIMPDRKWDSDTTLKYRFGFNSMERDDEAKGDGNSLDFGARIYDGRLGRWLSTDPKAGEYPDYSAYNFSINSPLMFGDPNGEWIEIKTTKYFFKKGVKTKKSWFRGLFRRAAIIEKEITVHDAKLIDIREIGKLKKSELEKLAKEAEKSITEKWTTANNKEHTPDEEGYITNSRGQKIKTVTTFAEPIEVVTDKGELKKGDNIIAIIDDGDRRIGSSGGRVPEGSSSIMYINDFHSLGSESFRDVTAHEFGHWLGLPDNKFNEELIMFNIKGKILPNNYPEPNEYKRTSNTDRLGLTNFELKTRLEESKR